MPKIDPTAGRAIDEAIGRRIKRRRTMLRFSQEMVAEKLGVSFQQLQKYENGKNRLAAGRLYDLAAIFDVPMDYFFEDWRPTAGMEANAEQRSAVPDTDPVFSRQGIKLLHAFARIPDEKTRRYVADLIDQLANAKQ